MSAPVFLVDAGAILGAGQVLVLDGDEGRHAVSVRRLVVGEPVECVDGAGRRACGRVAAVVGKDRLEIDVHEVLREAEPEPRLIVVQALAKGDRGEVAVQTLTEVGVDVIVPWSAYRAVVRWQGERADRGIVRWRRAAREAAKQARRARIPQVLDVSDTADVVTLLGSASCGLVLHEGAVSPLASRELPRSGDIVLVVGPEGGLTEDEVLAFEVAGALSCRLGPTVLRTSTAGTVAAAVVLSACGRWD